MTSITRYVVDTTDHRTVCTWLRTNEIDPNDIPIRTPILLEPDLEEFGEWRIRYKVFLRNSSGHRYMEAGTEELATQDLWKRLEIDPPMQWLAPLTD